MMGDKVDDPVGDLKSAPELSLNDEGESKPLNVSKKFDRMPKMKPGTRRFSVESVNLHQPSTISGRSNVDDVFLPSVSTNPVVHAEEEDSFIDLLVRSQGSRMNDQRCSVVEVGKDKTSEESETIPVDKSISDLRLSLGDESGSSSNKKQEKMTKKTENRRFSLENMNLLKYSPIKSTTDDDVFIPDGSSVNPVTLGARTTIHPTYTVHNSEEDHFLDLLVRFQGKRMNDQRCSLDPLKTKQ